MHVIVVGAGVGGLATAVALRMAGHKVTVVEQAPALGEVGAGVVLGPHAMRALEYLGADGHIRAINELPELSMTYDVITGEKRGESKFGAASREIYGADRCQTHRRDLIDSLALRLDGATQRLGSRVVGLTQTGKSVRLELQDGESVEGDILVGADGIRSTVRKCLFGEDQPDAVFTGFLAWRTVIDAKNMVGEQFTVSKLWFGGGRHVVSYPIRKGKQYYAAFYVPAQEISREDWSTSGDLSGLRSSFEGACQELRDLAASVSEAFITGIYYRDPLDVWHKGRVVLVGDAAHPVLPTSGSGAGFALEDAVTLSACLSRSPGDPSAAFEDFQRRRKPRTSRMLYISRADLRTYHEIDPDALAAIAALRRGVIQLDPIGVTRFAWLYGHDEVAAAARPIDGDKPEKTLLREPARKAFEQWSQGVSIDHAAGGWDTERAAYATFVAEACPVPPGTRVERIDYGGTPALRVIPDGVTSGPAVLHLHGGANMYGSAESSAGLAARIARAVGGWALVPDFGQAPESDPATILGRARAAYDWLAGETGSLLLSGECSGANIGLQLALAARDSRGVLPDAMIFVSPFVDLTLKNGSIDGNVGTEPWLARERLVNLAGAYVQGSDPRSPAISSAFADLSGLPDMLIVAAGTEALADDARNLAKRAAADGTEATLHMIEDSVHLYPIFDFLPETTLFFEDIGRWVGSRTQERGGKRKSEQGLKAGGRFYSDHGQIR